MATVGQVEVTGNVSGGADGQRTFQQAWVITNGVDDTQTVSLVNGSVTVTVPTGTTAIAIMPPNLTSPAPNPAYTGTLTLKGITGDTGFQIANNGPSYFTVPNGFTSFVITATASGSLVVWSA